VCGSYDKDVRVRMISAIHLPSLFITYPKSHCKIYDTFLLNLDNNFKEMDDTYGYVSGLMGIAFMAAHSDAIVNASISDMITIVSYKLSKTSACIVDSKFELVRTLIKYIATTKGYRLTSLFIKENFPRIISKWLNANSNLAIAEFPCIVLGFGTLETFVQEMARFILPFVIQFESKRQKSVLLELAEILKYAQSDVGVTLFLQHHFLILKAIEFFTFPEGVLTMSSRASVISSNLSKTLKKVMNEDIMRKVLINNMSDLIQVLLYM
jgi:hypothetical protein